MSGAVIYHGPSVLDGELILAIVTEGSENRKTGPMDQVWILRADRAPVEAAREGADVSVCGACPLRGREIGTLMGRACYVNLGQAPQAVWRAWQRGAYPSLPWAQLPAWGAGRTMRLGAYGDPAAVPFRVWGALLSRAAGWTGYTHQHGHMRFDERMASIVMASVQGDQSVPCGMRGFRVRAKGAPLVAGEVECPNTTHGVRCADCQLCQGMSKPGRSISIEAHGSGAKWVSGNQHMITL